MEKREKLEEFICKMEDTINEQFAKGVDNIDTEEMYKAVDILKDLHEANYYKSIVDAMEESDAEYGVDYDEQGMYDRPRKHYTRMRDSRGRYMSRRGYAEPMKVRPDYYRDMDRDMDRDMGRMYYPQSYMNGMNNMPNNNGGRAYFTDTHMNELDKLYADYLETKKMGDKSKTVMALEKYLKKRDEIEMKMMDDATPEELQMYKQKMQMSMQRY